MKTLGAPPPAADTPGPFSLADHGRLRGLLGAAGFGDIFLEDLELERGYESVEEWWGTALEPSGPLSAVLRQLTDEQLATVHEDALRGAREYVESDEAVRFPARVVVASAQRVA